jgi:hypothetical protein
MMSMSEKQMPEWEAICKKWAKNNNAELIFVNSNSFGVEINGSLRHIYIDELKEMLETEE